MCDGDCTSTLAEIPTSSFFWPHMPGHVLALAWQVQLCWHLHKSLKQLMPRSLLVVWRSRGQSRSLATFCTVAEGKIVRLSS